MRDQYTREKLDWEPFPVRPLYTVLSFRNSSSRFNALRNDRARLLSRRSVSCTDRVFSFRPAFRRFSCHGQPTYSAAVLPYWDPVLFRIGNLVLIPRRELSERPLLTRPPTEIPKSLSSKYWLIPRRTFKIQSLQPLCRVVDGANLGCWQPSGVGRDDMDSHPADWGVNHPVCSSVLSPSEFDRLGRTCSSSCVSSPSSIPFKFSFLLFMRGIRSD